MKKSQKGVSLVAVLLFMLVATIAGTATFKWVTSEGFSSASRMAISEARSASLAGVDAARSWITFHGNETGAILKQFIENDRKPMSLDPFLAPMAKESQKFQVTLVGVEASTKTSTYKLKIVSKGWIDGKSATYREYAILNVDGLYRMKLPKEKSSTDYHFSYFGGSTSFAGDHPATAMVINGNWGYGTYTKGSNPGRIENDFIVTGHAALSGSDLSVGGTTCVGGDLYIQNGFWGKDLFVGGNATGEYSWGNWQGTFAGQISGNAYFNKNLRLGQIADPGFDVAGNMTLNGQMYTNLKGFRHNVHGNLCLGDYGAIIFGSNEGEETNQFKIDKNVWIPASSKSGVTSGINTFGNSHFNNRVFGGEGYKAYIKDADRCENYSWMNGNCPTAVQMYIQNRDVAQSYVSSNTGSFMTQGQLISNLPDEKDRGFSCAESVKSYCDSIWHPGTGCDESKYKIDDMLKTGYESFEKYAGYADKSGISACRASDNLTKDGVRKMNECWNELWRDPNKKDAYLYNGYLVKKIKSTSGDVDDASAEKLTGKFILIFEARVTDVHLRVPRTSESGYVFLYLMDGANERSQDGGRTTHINASQKETYNYFIYTNRNIEGFLGEGTWSGSVYARAENCAGFPDVNGSTVLEYNPTIVSDMVSSGIVCDEKGPACTPYNGENDNTGDDSSDSTGTSFKGYDTDFIAVGSELMVSVESEYKSDEKVENNRVEVKPSLMVLPRVLYINSDAVGALSDYYSAVPLNGLQMDKNAQATVDCPDQPTAPPTSGKISDRPPGQGTYSCYYEYSAGGQKYRSDFKVVVAGEASSTPMVHFDGLPTTNFNIATANTGIVTIVSEASESQVPFSITIAKTDLPDGWTVSMADGGAVSWKIADDGSEYFVYSGMAGGKGGTKESVFKVTTGANPSPGTLRFTLRTPQGCIIGGGAVVKAFSIKGSVTIHRDGLDAFCARYPETCENNSEYLIAKDLQDCPPTSIWIRADGIGCNPVDGSVNDKWTCDAGVGAANKIILVKGEYNSAECKLYIPTQAEKNYIIDPQDDKKNPGGDTLYASLKRKYYTLTVKVTDATDRNTGVRIDTATTSASKADAKNLGNCTSKDGCSFIVYANQYVKLTPVQHGADHFSKWNTDGKYNKDQGDASIVREYVVGSNRSLEAIFNEKDKHCFYSDFKNTAIWCSSDIQDCLDYCRMGYACDISGGHYERPNWIQVNTNGMFAKPNVSSGFIRNSSGYGTSMIMNSVEGGSEGEYTVRVRSGMVSTLSAKKNTDFLNSGLVVRSKKDGSEHISVNIYGVNVTGSDYTAAVTTHIRVCYSSTTIKVGNDHCKDVPLRGVNLGLNAFSWTAGSQLNMVISVRGDSLHVLASYAGTAGIVQVEGELDLKDVVQNAAYTLNDDAHSYVGIKLTDASFGVYDASWSSDRWKSECFADPSIYCSFADNYMAGEVPLNEDVSPSVGYSSWFMNEGSSCMDKTTFYYNGCDLASSKFNSFLGVSSLFNNFAYCKNDVCGEGHVENYFTHDGFNLKNSTYYFGCEAKHGYQHETRDGIVRNASVVVNCNAVNGKKYSANCGEFYVGRHHGCQEDYDFVTTPQPHGYEYVEIPAPNSSVANLRESNIMFGLTFGMGVFVKVKLVDANNVSSDAITINQSGPNLISYDKFADRYGFNPEKVAKIVMQSNGWYTIDSVSSYCANRLKVYCGQGDATYLGDYWRIDSNIDPYDKAQKCKVVANHGDIKETYFGNCNEAGVFTLSDPDFYERLNDGASPITYDFTVSVYDDPNATETSEPSSTCIAQTQSYSPVDAVCDLVDSKGTYVQGSGVPAVKFEAVNCPAEGCEYELTLDGVTEYTHSDKIKGVKSWGSALNTASQLPAGSYHYTFKLFNDDKSAMYKSCTTPSFDVVQAQKASAENCSIVGNHFMAYVTASNYEDVIASLVYADNLGNVISTKTVKINSNTDVDFDLSSLPAGNYTLALKLYGNEAACSLPYNPGGSTQTTSVNATCPGKVTGQSPESAIAVSPTVTGCDNKCTWEVVGATAGGSGSGYNTGNISFYDANGTGTKSYTFKVSKTESGKTLTSQCNFEVEYVSASTTASAVCGVSDAEIEKGNGYVFTMTSIVPDSKQIHLEVTIDGAKKIDSYDYWSPLGYTATVMPSSVGTSTVVAKVNGTTVCEKSVTVKELAANTIIVGNSGPVQNPATNTDLIMRINGCSQRVAFGSNTGGCSFKMNGKTYTFSYYEGWSISGDFASGNVFNNVNGCVTQISCY